MGKHIGLRSVALLLVLALLLPAAGCAGPAASFSDGQMPVSSQEEQSRVEAVELSIACVDPVGSLTEELLMDCAAQWRKETGGRADVDIYAGGPLGDDQLLLTGAVQGTLSVVKTDVCFQEDVVPESALLAIPYTFDSPDELLELMAGPYGEVFRSYYERAGLRLLHTAPLSWKYITASVPVRTAADLGRLQIRVLDNPAEKRFWRACGADPRTLEDTKLYMDLKEGTVNAQESSLEAVQSFSLAEVQDYLIDAGHQLNVHTFVMNLEQYNALPDDIQIELGEWLENFSAQYLRTLEEGGVQTLQQLEEEGMSRSVLPAAVRRHMEEAREPVIQELRQTLGDEAVDQFLNAVAEVKSQS